MKVKWKLDWSEMEKTGEIAEWDQKTGEKLKENERDTRERELIETRVRSKWEEAETNGDTIKELKWGANKNKVRGQEDWSETGMRLDKRETWVNLDDISFSHLTSSFNSILNVSWWKIKWSLIKHSPFRAYTLKYSGIRTKISCMWTTVVSLS